MTLVLMGICDHSCELKLSFGTFGTYPMCGTQGGQLHAGDSWKKEKATWEGEVLNGEQRSSKLGKVVEADLDLTRRPSGLHIEGALFSTISWK